MATTTHSFLTGANATYIAELYRRYIEDPNSVEPSWASFFADLGDESRVVLGDVRGASWALPRLPIDGDGDGTATAAVAKSALATAPAATDLRASILDSIRALMLIRTYRVRGHLNANFDPLGLEGKKHHPELDPATHGFTEADMDRPIFIANVLGMETATLREILQVLRETYCGSIGVEFMHIQHPDEQAWI